MDDPIEQDKDKRKKALGPIGQWLKKRREKKALADHAAAVASAVTAKLIAAAVTAGVLGGAAAGAGVQQVTKPAAVVDTSGQVAAVEELASGLEQDVALLNELAEDLNNRIGSLATALSAGGSVTAIAIDEMQSDLAAISQDIGVVEGMIEGHSRDLASVIENQNTLGVRSESVDRRLATIEAGLDTVSVTASNARAQALVATDLAREALDDADAVASDVAALADQVDALAQGVQDQASKLDSLADDVAELGDGLAALNDRVDDLEDRVAAEEAEQPITTVQENPYDDSELRQRIEAAELDVDNLETWQPRFQRITGTWACNAGAPAGVNFGGFYAANAGYTMTMSAFADAAPGTSKWMQAQSNTNGGIWGQSPVTTDDRVAWAWPGNPIYNNGNLNLWCDGPTTWSDLVIVYTKNGDRP